MRCGNLLYALFAEAWVDVIEVAAKAGQLKNLCRPVSEESDSLAWRLLYRL